MEPSDDCGVGCNGKFNLKRDPTPDWEAELLLSFRAGQTVRGDVLKPLSLGVIDFAEISNKTVNQEKIQRHKETWYRVKILTLRRRS